MSDPDNPLQAVQVRIYGRVQGVWFRGWAVTAATALDLTGWVRNRADGSVEALFVGSSDNVEAMIANCRDGPPGARVDEVVRETPAAESIEETGAAGFRQLPTL